TICTGNSPKADHELRLKPDHPMGSGHVSAAYLYTHGSYGGVVSNPHWNQGQVSVDYFLSKRTDVYAYANYIRASGSNAPAVLFLSSKSSTNAQTAVVVGVRHKF
ncbi:porin, partial [Burkholderia multivorans]|uniref:porin n=1 Tax=Burkholderia multivorans TaxID=87883 RepID=UPI002157128E